MQVPNFQIKAKMRAYLESNAYICGRVVASVLSLQLVALLMIFVNIHLHKQRTRQIQA